MINLKYLFLLVIAMKANILSVLINPAQELRNMPWTLHTIIRSSKENSSHLNQFIQISAKKTCTSTAANPIFNRTFISARR